MDCLGLAYDHLYYIPKEILMNTKPILVAAVTLSITSCSMFSGENVDNSIKNKYTHPDFSVPKPSPYRAANSTEKRKQHIFASEFDSSELPNGAKINIQPHVNYLISNPTKKVSIQGSADSIGGKAYNYALGMKRANRVADLMIELGVDPSQIVVTSSGEERSLYIPQRSVVLAY